MEELQITSSHVLLSDDSVVTDQQSLTSNSPISVCNSTTDSRWPLQQYNRQIPAAELRAALNNLKRQSSLQEKSFDYSESAAELEHCIRADLSPITEVDGKLYANSSLDSFENSPSNCTIGASSTLSSQSHTFNFSRASSFLENSLVGKLSLGWQDEPDSVAVFLSGQYDKLGKDGSNDSLYDDNHTCMFIAPDFEFKQSPFLSKIDISSIPLIPICTKMDGCSTPLTHVDTYSESEPGLSSRDTCSYSKSLKLLGMSLSEIKSIVYADFNEIKAKQLEAAQCLSSQFGNSIPSSPGIVCQDELSNMTCNLFSTTIISAPLVVDSSTRFPSSPLLPTAASSAAVSCQTPPNCASSRPASPNTPFQTASTPTKTPSTLGTKQYTFHQTPSQVTLHQLAGTTPGQKTRRTSGDNTTRGNPFDSCVEVLQLPTVSPSLFKEVKSPGTARDSDTNFRWSIEQLALLNPASIEVPSTHGCFESPQDPEYEKQAQEAIDKFFNRCCILPSPWTSNFTKSKWSKDAMPYKYSLPTNPNSTPSMSENIVRICSGPARCKDTDKKIRVASNTVSCQTELSLPFVLPPQLQAMLALYTNANNCGSDTSDGSNNLFSGMSLKRRLMFSNDDLSSCSPVMQSATKSSTKRFVYRGSPIRLTPVHTHGGSHILPKYVFEDTSPIVSGIHSGLVNDFTVEKSNNFATRCSFSPFGGEEFRSPQFESISPIKFSEEPRHDTSGVNRSLFKCEPSEDPVLGRNISPVKHFSKISDVIQAVPATSQLSPIQLAEPVSCSPKEHCNNIEIPAVERGIYCKAASGDEVSVANDQSMLSLPSCGPSRSSISSSTTIYRTCYDTQSNTYKNTSGDVSHVSSVCNHTVVNSATNDTNLESSGEKSSDLCPRLNNQAHGLTQSSDITLSSNIISSDTTASIDQSAERPCSRVDSKTSFTDDPLSNPIVCQCALTNEACFSCRQIRPTSQSHPICPSRPKCSVPTATAPATKVSPLASEDKAVTSAPPETAHHYEHYRHQEVWPRTPRRSVRPNWRRVSSQPTDAVSAAAESYTPKSTQFSSSPIRECATESTKLLSPTSCCSASPFSASPIVSPILRRRGARGAGDAVFGAAVAHRGGEAGTFGGAVPRGEGAVGAAPCYGEGSAFSAAIVRAGADGGSGATLPLAAAHAASEGSAGVCSSTQQEQMAAMLKDDSEREACIDRQLDVTNLKAPTCISAVPVTRVTVSPEHQHSDGDQLLCASPSYVDAPLPVDSCRGSCPDLSSCRESCPDISMVSPPEILRMSPIVMDDSSLIHPFVGNIFSRMAGIRDTKSRQELSIGDSNSNFRPNLGRSHLANINSSVDNERVGHVQDGRNLSIVGDVFSAITSFSASDATTFQYSLSMGDTELYTQQFSEAMSIDASSQDTGYQTGSLHTTCAVDLTQQPSVMGGPHCCSGVGCDTHTAAPRGGWSDTSAAPSLGLGDSCPGVPSKQQVTGVPCPRKVTCSNVGVGDVVDTPSPAAHHKLGDCSPPQGGGDSPSPQALSNYVFKIFGSSAPCTDQTTQDASTS